MNYESSESIPCILRIVKVFVSKSANKSIKTQENTEMSKDTIQGRPGANSKPINPNLLTKLDVSKTDCTLQSLFRTPGLNTLGMERSINFHRDFIANPNTPDI